jgi:demethylmenaquinone methyltransferase/2-methoxy-6-polyprenyl-1,4-benzoquinol methylase
MRTTHFGYKNVPVDEKVDHVRGVFDSVATRYDIMNDLMSGTGDLALKFARQVGPQGHVVLADINAAMLEQGRRRLVDAGVAGNLTIAQVDAEELPFEDASFDRITIAFGLRNVTDKDAALASMYRVLKPGGKVLILEFSEPAKSVKPVYDLYSFRVLPLIGKIVARDEDSYQYLAESIRMHPDQETLLQMMTSAGFERCRYQNLAAGVVALHIGYRI